MNGLCLLVLLCSCVVTMATNPGLKLRLSDKGLNYAASVAIDQLTSDVQGRSIPDQHGEDHVAIGKISYDLTGIRINSFTRPASSIVVNPGSGITWSLTNAGVSGHGDWHYKYRKAFIKLSDHGSFDISVSGVSVTVGIAMGVDSKGRPTIATRSCSCNVGDVNVKFHGGAAWLYNLFRHMAEKPIQKAIQSMLCKSINKAINVDAKSSLEKMKVRVPIEGLLTLDYSLAAAPVFGSNYIESLHKGEFFWTMNPTESPYSPQPMGEQSGAHKMVTFYLSDYVTNTLGYALFKYASQFMKYNLTKKDLPADAQRYLNTSTIPQLAKKYPNGTMELHMRITAAPSLQTTTGTVSGHLKGQVDFRVRLPDNSLAESFTVDMTANVSLAVKMTGDKITAHVKNFKFDTKVTKSAIGPIPPPVINLMFHFAAQGFIVPKLNEFGQKGFKVPGIDHVQFVDPQLYLMEGAICFTTDAKYDPSLKFKPYARL